MSWRDLMYLPGFGGNTDRAVVDDLRPKRPPPPPPPANPAAAVGARKEGSLGKKRAGSSDRPLAGSETLLSDVSGVKGPLAPSPKVY